MSVLKAFFLNTNIFFQHKWEKCDMFKQKINSNCNFFSDDVIQVACALNEILLGNGRYVSFEYVYRLIYNMCVKSLQCKVYRLLEFIMKAVSMLHIENGKDITMQLAKQERCEIRLIRSLKRK